MLYELSIKVIITVGSILFLIGAILYILGISTAGAFVYLICSIFFVLGSVMELASFIKKKYTSI